MRNRGHAPCFEFLYGLHDLVPEIDPADALVSLLNSGRLPGDRDLEPDPADARRLNSQIAGLTRDARVGPVAPDDRIESAVSAHLLIDDDVDEHVASQPQAG